VKILWFDPGGTTGWATFECTEVVGPDGIEYYDTKWNAGEISGEKHHNDVDILIGLQHSDHNFTVGYEKFHLQKKEGREGIDYMALEYIGCIELVCHRDQRDIPVVTQLPMERLFADDRKLNIFELYRLTRGQKDARAAARHLLTYLIKTLRYPPIMRQLEIGLRD
jgi:hypothetical protein